MFIKLEFFTVLSNPVTCKLLLILKYDPYSSELVAVYHIENVQGNSKITILKSFFLYILINFSASGNDNLSLVLVEAVIWFWCSSSRNEQETKGIFIGAW